MARPRRQPKRPTSPSSSINNKGSYQHKSRKGTNKNPEDEQGDSIEAMNPETPKDKEIAGLDLGTDEDTSDEDETQETDARQWQQVSKKRSKGAHPTQQVTPIEEEPQVSSPKSPLIQLDMEDVDEGIEYWSNAIFGYVLGANPPWNVIHGYAHRVWKGKGIEQVSFMPNGIFLVRFNTKEAQQEAMLNDALLFDNKPVILEEWTPNACLVKKEIKEVPIWIKLRNLELRFWGERCFAKLTSGVGRYIECDTATKNKQFLGYAKVKVMVKLDQHFPSTLQFLDEIGQEQLIGFSYDWLPVTCKECNNIGHARDECRKNKPKSMPKRTWQPKVHQPIPKGGNAQDRDTAQPLPKDHSPPLLLSCRLPVPLIR